MQNFFSPIKSFLFKSKTSFSEIKDELEELLLAADVGVEATQKLLNKLSKDSTVIDAQSAYVALKKACLKIFEAVPFVGDVSEEVERVRKPFCRSPTKTERVSARVLAASEPKRESETSEEISPTKENKTIIPTVYFFVGVNGVGKTTTLGKLGAKFVAEGGKVCFVAADTFRAASCEQLGVWAKRIGAELVSSKMGADPASVVHEGITKALASQVDVVLVDTAGRLQTKTNLMQELSKMTRVAEKVLGRKSDGIFLILDATTGQNALSQAKLFCEAAPVSGLILTKYDSTAKGGIILSVVAETGLPLLYLGVGEKTEDLIPFDAKEFVENLFD